MKIKEGNGSTKYGPGISIELSGEDVVNAIMLYLFSKDLIINGPRTIMVNNSLCHSGKVYVDPEGTVMIEGKRFEGDKIFTDKARKQLIKINKKI